MSLTPDLTICSVSYYTKDYLQLNLKLAKRLNPNVDLLWLVVENTPDVREQIDNSDGEFVILEGAEPPRNSRPDLNPLAAGSYHHAAGLTKALPHLKSRFVLILDPDFYLVSPDWINTILNHMKAQDLGLFGVPWHPKWYIKYRYFPCVHCVFIDLERVNIETLDLHPAYGSAADPVINERSSAVAHIRKVVPGQLASLVRILMLKDRKAIGSSRDTGYHVFDRYSHDSNVRFECAVPVYNPKTDFQGPAYALANSNRYVEKLLPDRLCFIPKQAGYFSEKGFSQLGYPDVSSMGWEEFLWQGAPFGFHIRRFMQGSRDVKQEMEVLTNVLEGF